MKKTPKFKRSPNCTCDTRPHSPWCADSKKIKKAEGEEMKQKSDFKLSRTGRGYAFELQEGLCNWAFPSAHDDEAEELPSPEAQVVSVRILKESDFRKLHAAYKLIVAQNKKMKTLAKRLRF